MGCADGQEFADDGVAYDHVLRSRNLGYGTEIQRRLAPMVAENAFEHPLVVHFDSFDGEAALEGMVGNASASVVGIDFEVQVEPSSLLREAALSSSEQSSHPVSAQAY